MAIFFPILSLFLFLNCMLKIKSSWDPRPHRPVWGSISSRAVGAPATPAAVALVKGGDLERKGSREIKPFYTGNQLKWVKGLFLPRAPRPSGSDSIDAILKACHIHCVLKHLIICDSLQRGSLSSAVLGGVVCSSQSPEHHVEPGTAGWKSGMGGCLGVPGVQHGSVLMEFSSWHAGMPAFVQGFPMCNHPPSFAFALKIDEFGI